MIGGLGEKVIGRNYIVLFPRKYGKAHNKTLFENAIKSDSKVVNRVVCKKFHLERGGGRVRWIGYPPTSSFEVIGYFNGASQDGGMLCGDGGYISSKDLDILI